MPRAFAGDPNRSCEATRGRNRSIDVAYLIAPETFDPAERYNDILQLAVIHDLPVLEPLGMSLEEI